MNQPIARAQAGVMLLEALIAILVFSLGILSLVALQATSIQLTSDAKYRTDASLLANRLIGQMWASGGTPETLQENFDIESSDSGAPGFVDWRDNHVRASNALPGVVAGGNGVVSTLPTVVVTLVPPAPGTPTSAQVDVTLFWRTPQMRTNEPGHRHVVTSQIAFQNP